MCPYGLGCTEGRRAMLAPTGWGMQDDMDVRGAVRSFGHKCPLVDTACVALDDSVLNDSARVS